MPTYTRTFENFTPPRRYDGVPFTKAHFQESSQETSGFTTVETFNLSPVDSDPSAPQSRNFTTDLATLAAGWYRIEWEDAGGAIFDSAVVYYPSQVSSSALTSLGAVRAYLQKGAGDTAQDTLIDSLITRASVAIMAYAEREFAPATADATRTFEYRGGGYLDLAPYDLRSITTIRTDSDETSPTTLNAVTDYRLYPQPNPDGVFTAVRLNANLIPDHAVFHQRLVEIRGAWGFAAIPEDVAHWCIVTVALWLRRDVAAFETNFSLDEERLEHPQALPSAARAGLAHYRRLAV